MSVESVQARIGQIAARYESFKSRPKELFQQVLQEKMGIQSMAEAATQEVVPQSVAMSQTDFTGASSTATQQYCIKCGLPHSAASAYGQSASGTPADFSKAAPYMGIVQDVSQRYGMPSNLILGIMKAESDFNNNCVSSAGAKGLMQLMPETAAEVGVTDVFDPAQNIEGSVKYITKLVERYNGDVKLALAAYNTGPGKVARKGITSSNSPEYLTLPQSIRDYADRVLRYAGYSL